MAKLGLLFDVERCTGCYNCFLSCKDEFVFNDYLPHSVSQPDDAPAWIRIQEVEYGTHDKVKVDYVHQVCQQCENAPCMRPEFGDAVYRRADGIVMIDPVKAKGNKEIEKSCPYGAISWSDEHNVAQKCTMCAHMLDAGEKKTRCSEACPTEALLFGDLNDPDSVISKRLAAKADRVDVLKPELGTEPVVRYISIPKPILAGEVIFSDKTGECAGEVNVSLSAADGKKFNTKTDFLGDFEFKRLTPGAEYVLSVEHKGYATKQIPVQLKGSLNLGAIVLDRQ